MNTEQSAMPSMVKRRGRAIQGALKGSRFFAAFCAMATPLLEAAWLYGLHFSDRRLFLRSPYARIRRPDMTRRGIELLPRLPFFVDFAKRLRASIPEETLQRKRQAMLGRRDEMAFTEEIELDLDADTRAELLEFATSDEVLSRVLPYFGMVPRIETALVMLNIPHPELREPAGSQLWHRDGGYYKMLTLWLYLSDLDADSGPYCAINASRFPYRTEIPLPHSPTPVAPSWSSSRHPDDLVDQYVDPSEVLRLEGPLGTAALVDSALCYHKGGFCKLRERLALGINYTTDQVQAAESIVDHLGIADHPSVRSLLESPVNQALLLRPSSPQLGKFVFRVMRSVFTTYARPLAGKAARNGASAG